MFNNPLIQRYRYSTMRPRQFWIYVTIYISIILLIVFINYSSYKYQAFCMSITEFYESLYYQFLTFQAIILFMWGAYNSGSAIREEILNKSYDFFRMLPIPAYKKAFGILIGKNLVVLLFGGINLVLLVCFGLGGKININLQWQIILILISITIFSNVTYLLLSTNPASRNKSTGVLLMLLGIFFFVPMMISSVAALADIEELESYPVHFYRMKVPILLLISFIAFYFSCWFFKGILRRFTYEQEPLFTRTGALLFLFGYIFIAAGLYYHYLQMGKSEVVYSYWIFTLLPVLFIPLFSLRQIDDYIEYSRFIFSQPDLRKRGIVSMLIYSNLCLVIILFAMWAVSAIGASFFVDYTYMQHLSNLCNIFILLSCYLFFILLLELYVVYVPVSKTIGLLLGFIAVLYVILPLILSTIFDSEVILLYSPAGFIYSLFDDSHTNVTIKTSFFLMNVLCCVVDALLIWKCYNRILAQRQKM